MMARYLRVHGLMPVLFKVFVNMKFLVVIIFVFVHIIGFSAAGGGPDEGGKNHGEPSSCSTGHGDHHTKDHGWYGQSDTPSSCAIPGTGKTSVGKPSTPSPIQSDKGGDDEDQGPPIPIGQPRGPILPSSPNVTLGQINNLHTRGYAGPFVKRQQCRGEGIQFGNTNVFGSSLPYDSGGTNEPSGAQAGNVIFSTSNFAAAVSFDGGLTFHDLDPTVYSGAANAATDGGFCCDQIVEYLPSIDRFVWLMQYWKNSLSVNKLRVITFHPSDVTATGINSWIYTDFISTDLGLGNGFDAGDLSVGNSQLFLSVNDPESGKGVQVIRIPIAALNVVGSYTYWHTNSADGATAYLSRIAQNAGDTAYWAGHSILGTQMQIFRWPESDNSYYWTFITIDDWPTDASQQNAPCAGAKTGSWAYGVSFTRVLAGTRRTSNELWFAWFAGSGGGFPHVQVQVVQLNVANWPNLSLIKQWQIWNPNFAFAYPALWTNQCGDVGVAVAFGSGPYNSSSAVGIATSDGILTQTVYYAKLSDACTGRFGDYFTVRSDGGVGFIGFLTEAEAVSSGLQMVPRYMEFGRG
jgi:hypothetical protein